MTQSLMYCWGVEGKIKFAVELTEILNHMFIELDYKKPLDSLIEVVADDHQNHRGMGTRQ